MEQGLESSGPQRTIKIPVPHVNIKKLGVPILLLIVGFLCGMGLMNIIKKDNNAPKKTMTILATGTVEVPADEGVLSAYENKEFSTEQEANSYSTTIQNQLKSAFDAIKLPKDSYIISASAYDTGGRYGMITQSASPITSIIVDISPTPTPSGYILQRQPTGKSFNASINVTIYLKKDQFGLIDRISQIISQSGISQPPYTSYMATITQEYKNKARSSALMDANKQTEDLKELNNIRVGDVVSIKDMSIPTEKKGSDSSYYPPSFPNSGGEKIYIEAGKKSGTYTTSYQIVYVLK